MPREIAVSAQISPRPRSHRTEGFGIFRTGRTPLVAAGIRFQVNTCSTPDVGFDLGAGPFVLRDNARGHTTSFFCGGALMKVEISEEWCMRMAQLEGDAEIGAGRLAVDPVFDGEAASSATSDEEGPIIAFGRFVNLMRRHRGLSLEKLADNSDADMTDLVEIESDPHHRPEPRTVYRLANYFDVPHSGLLQMAGLATPKDATLFNEAVRFAARSEPTAALTPEEGAALESFVAVLSEQK